MTARLALCLLAARAAARNNLSVTPPMGFLSWEMFRCDLVGPGDDCTDPATTRCVSEALYRGVADALVASGLAAAGYATVHLDDCWQAEARTPGGALAFNASRFPSGGLALARYLHTRGLNFGFYTKFTTVQCPGAVTFPPTQGFEAVDAASFAAWEVDYLKADACGGYGDIDYARDYRALGASLEASGREIEYSCSWPAYMGDDESAKPFGTFISDGCNGWRNWADIQCNWGSLAAIIDHWGDYCSVLAPWAGPGHWHDPDMLLIGNGCITTDEERTQMAIWCIVAAPLLMGNDPRSLNAASKAILLNPHAIAVSQDRLGQMGLRLENMTGAPQQTWFRALADGGVAVALYNKLGPLGPPCPPAAWNATAGGYFDSLPPGSGGAECFDGSSVAAAEATCCASYACAGFSIDASGHGCFKPNADAGFVANGAFSGYFKRAPLPPADGAANVTLRFADVGLYSPRISVFDIWAQLPVGIFEGGSYTAANVPLHGSAFLKLSTAA
jgi:alpha-N-acetylgalactosaminidase